MTAVEERIELLPRSEETDMDRQYALMAGFLHEELYGLPINDDTVRTEISINLSIAAGTLAETLALAHGIDPELDIFSSELIESRLNISNRGEPEDLTIYIDSDPGWKDKYRVDDEFINCLTAKALQIAGVIVTEYEEQLDFLYRMADLAVTDWVMLRESEDNIEPSMDERATYREQWLEQLRQAASRQPQDNTGTETT